MEVLVLGSGAREHALAWRLARDERVERVRIAPGNPGTAAVGHNVADLDPLDARAVARFASRERIGLVVVGAETPLAAGVADALEQAAIPVFGPSRAAARLEWSKAYARRQLSRAGVPVADGEDFADPAAAGDYARRRWEAGRPVVVKADWLAAGKGVVIPESADEAAAAGERLLAEGPDGGRVVVEERLAGREVSLFALVSGETAVPLGAACDYKRLRDGDDGPNTGGMGAYSPVPWFDARSVEQATGALVEPVAWRMARDGIPYRGILYVGLMVTDRGPFVLELNARFGDPEAQVLLPMLDGDLAAALAGTALGDRAAMQSAVVWRSGAAVGVVLASEGYPDQPVTGRALRGADPATPADSGPLLVFHGGTRRRDGQLESGGGRVATFVGIGADLGAARETAYRGAAECRLDGAQYRTDVAQRELGG